MKMLHGALVKLHAEVKVGFEVDSGKGVDLSECEASGYLDQDSGWNVE